MTFKFKEENMARVQYDHYVAVLDKNGAMQFVTQVDNSTKQFFCEKGKEAVKLREIAAKDLVHGMACNFIPAVILTSVKGVYNPRN